MTIMGRMALSEVTESGQLLSIGDDSSLSEMRLSRVLPSDDLASLETSHW